MIIHTIINNQRIMKTTKKQFELFKSECQKWIDRFELSGWRFDFYLEELVRAQALVIRAYEECVITVKFNTTLERSDERSFDEVIIETAKHEMIHALIGNLATMAYAKYVTESEITKTEEELVRKLDKIIK